MTLKADEAAKILCIESDWTVTNLNLHKVLYLAAMAYIGHYEEPLIEEPFSATDFGPVILPLFKRLECFGAGPIGNLFHAYPDTFEGKERDIVCLIWNNVYDFSPGQFVANTKTHDGAWAKNYEPRMNKIIPNSDMLEEFYQRIKSVRSSLPL